MRCHVFENKYDCFKLNQHKEVSYISYNLILVRARKADGLD